MPGGGSGDDPGGADRPRLPRAPRRRDVRAAAVVALAAAVGYLLLTAVVVAGHGEPLPVDASIGSAAVSTGTVWVPALALVLGVIGGGPVSTVVVTVVVVLLLVARRPWPAAYLVLSGLGGAIVNTAAKALVNRQRPPWLGMYALEDSSSYPSGHAMAGITVYVAMGVVALIVLRRPWRTPVAVALFVFGPVVGVSRVLVGVHWPSDVLGGWLLGIAWTSAVASALMLSLVRRQGAYGAVPGSSSACTVVNS